MQLHGLAPSGDAAFEAVDEVWREAFEPGEQGAQGHEDAFIEYFSGNIGDARLRWLLEETARERPAEVQIAGMSSDGPA